MHTILHNRDGIDENLSKEALLTMRGGEKHCPTANRAPTAHVSWLCWRLRGFSENQTYTARAITLHQPQGKAVSQHNFDRYIYNVCKVVLCHTEVNKSTVSFIRMQEAVGSEWKKGG